MNILVAEDDRDIADLIAHCIERSGWTPHTVGSGDDALARARKTCRSRDSRRHAAGHERLEVCRALRADSVTNAIPIIIVTARAEETDRIVGLDIAPTTTSRSRSARTSWSRGSVPSCAVRSGRSPSRRRSS